MIMAVYKLHGNQCLTGQVCIAWYKVTAAILNVKTFKLAEIQFEPGRDFLAVSIVATGK